LRGSSSPTPDPPAPSRRPAPPILGLDALGSASYGPEAKLAILLPLGALGLGVVWEITAGIGGLVEPGSAVATLQPFFPLHDGGTRFMCFAL
jgi:hypothetical protein